jgi:repressor LexA
MARIEEFEQQQARVLAYIREHVEQNGFPPSVREIGERFGYLSPSGPHNLLRALVDRGLLTVRRDTPRAMTITEAGMKALTEEL